MSYTTFISAPVSIRDLQRCFGLSNTDLGTLIANGNINKWAKYKPVIVAGKVVLLSDSDRENANYGFSLIPTWSNINNMFTFWLLESPTTPTKTNWPSCDQSLSEPHNISEYWKYSKPTGGNAAPFRITDFVKENTQYGYFHFAEAPVGPIANTEIHISSNGQMRVVYVNGSYNQYMSLTYADLKYDNGGQISLSGYYFGVMLCKTTATSSDTKYAITEMTASDILQQGAYAEAWFETKNAVGQFMGSGNSATFYVMPYFSNVQLYTTFTKNDRTYRTFKTDLGQTTGAFIALLPRQQVTIVKNNAKIALSNLTAWKNSTSSRLIGYSFTITNSEADISHAYKITITLYDSNSGVINSSILTGTLSGGASRTVNSSIDGGQYYSAATLLSVTTEINTQLDNAILTVTDGNTVTIVNNPDQPVIDPDA